MRTLLLPILILFADYGFTQSSVVYFEKDRYTLTNKAKDELDELAYLIEKENDKSEIALIGHTDSDASVGYNDDLALNRAHSVRKYLDSLGVKNRFHVLSKGEHVPINSNSDESEKSKNRRVEIQRHYQPNNGIEEHFKQAPQIYSLNPYESQSITTAYGTKLNFPKSAFKDVLPHLPVKLHVREYYNKQDFILGGLSTHTTSGDILESRGMLEVYAIQNQDTLELESGKKMDILFPDRTVNDGTQIFAGVDHGHEVEWDQKSFNTVRTRSEQGWSYTYYPRPKGNDTIRWEKWWYETIDDQSFKIRHVRTKESEQYDTLDIENEELLSELTLSSTNLGWINCDRFWEENSPKVDVMVAFEGDEVPAVSIVFSDINAILPYSYRENNRVVFKNIPMNRAVTFIALHKDKKTDQVYFARAQGSASPVIVPLLKLKESTDDEIKTILSQL